MRVPDKYLPHIVTVQPYQGTGARGPVHGPSFPLRCMAQGGRKLVRDADGHERVSELQLIAAPGQASKVPTGSLVTHNGHTTTVLSAKDLDSGGLGAPDHTEVVCE